MWQRPVGRLPIVAEISALTSVGFDPAALPAPGRRQFRTESSGRDCAFAGRSGGMLRYNARVSRSAVPQGSHRSEALVMLARCGVLRGAVSMSGTGLGRVPPSR